jgi:hypothetical protein
MKISTKLLTSLAFAGAVALPFLVSSAYAEERNNIPSGYYAQDIVKCDIEKQSGNRALTFANACLKEEVTAQIDPEVLQFTSRVIKMYAEAPAGTTGKDSDRNGAPEFIKAYQLLYNKANVRDCKWWTYQYESNRQACTNIN